MTCAAMWAGPPTTMKKVLRAQHLLGRHLAGHQLGADRDDEDVAAEMSEQPNVSVRLMGRASRSVQSM
jgi:hypothetical protein